MCVMRFVLLAVAHIAYVALVGGLSVPLHLLFMMLACADCLHIMLCSVVRAVSIVFCCLFTALHVMRWLVRYLQFPVRAVLFALSQQPSGM